MTAILVVLSFTALVLALALPTGAWLHRVLEGDTPPGARLLGPLERACYRALGVDPRAAMTAPAYLGAVLTLSLVSGAATFLLLLAQGALPWNPRQLPGLSWHLALNTAVSFTTNTNWQSYGGEATLSNLSQALALVPHQFLSAAVGAAVAVATVRGITRRDSAGTVGNFWQDLTRLLLYVLLPLSLAFSAVLVVGGVPQTLTTEAAARTLEGAPQTILTGPVASMVAIKMLGTNGGGFYNANAAHPLENPSWWVNALQMLSIFLLPAGLVHTYGRMSGDRRNGYAILAAMAALFVVGALAVIGLESGALSTGLPVWEGKESRFGIVMSGLFAAVTTSASCGAVNAMHDSFSALGGMVPLVLIQLGEVVFGGVGAGLYGILVYVVVTVFLAGLMVGRTPELLGKKLEAKEIQLAALYLLVSPLAILIPASLAASSAWGLSSLANPGPHGWTEILYAFSSAAGNNGSAFAGLNANTPAYNVLLAASMLAGRFAMLAPALLLGGALARKRALDPGPGTFPTTGALFSALLVGVLVIVGALTFFPALALGPIAEAAS